VHLPSCDWGLLAICRWYWSSFLKTGDALDEGAEDDEELFYEITSLEKLNVEFPRSVDVVEMASNTQSMVIFIIGSKAYYHL
jgi:hypothetical protein